MVVSILMLIFIVFYSLFVVIPDFKIRNSEPIPVPTSASLSSKKLWSLIQDWRSSEKLQPYTEDQRLCKIAEDRVLNDFQLDNHEGLYKKYSNLPYVIQENLGLEPSEEKQLAGWLKSPSHAATLRMPYTHSCVYCNDNYCSQIFSNF